MLCILDDCPRKHQAHKWDIVDGQRSYDFWANGLAFTGGHRTPTTGWVEPAGVRQATIDFGQAMEFWSVNIWHHGLDHTPAHTELDYWNGSQWIDSSFNRLYG